MLNRLHVLLYLSLIFNTSILNASVYDEDILNIFSKVLPRLVLMSSQTNDIKDEINICLLRDDIDERTATSLIEKTNKYYPNGIKNYQINFIKTNYSNINQCINTAASFLLNSNDPNIKHALEFSHAHKILTISYDSKLLKDGVDISMFLGRKVTPYINAKSIRNKDIELNNTLLRISKIYNSEPK